MASRIATVHPPTAPAPPRPAEARGAGSASVGLRWAALTEAGAAVAALAGVPPEPARREIRNLPAQLHLCDDWRRALAENAIEDLAAVMESGLRALLATRARGGDCQPAAIALFREFSVAQAAVVALAPPSGALGPLRRA